MERKITNFIAKQNIIDSELCDDIVNTIKELEWTPHQWYSHHDKYSHTNEEKELDVCYGDQIPRVVQEQLMMHINAVYNLYVESISELLGFEKEFFNMIKYWSPARMNRYSEGTLMRPHYDHIHSLFEGEARGIPVLSVVGCLNDDYQGGDFVFFNDFKIKLDKGDILLFPSNFVYPHRVEEVTDGQRYSFVSWGF